MKALEKVRIAGELLERSGISDPRIDAEQIIAHCLGISRIELFRDDPDIGEEAMSLVDGYLQRRARREPLQYILGFVEFHGLIMRVGRGVLIPRPETELLVEETISLLRGDVTETSKLSILDMCAGCGCISLALAKEFPRAEVYGVDISETAIRYAVENARRNKISNVTFLWGSLFDPVRGIRQIGASVSIFDIIVSNPPYIRAGDIAMLEPEIRDWEPREAVNGGEDGLDFYRAIIPSAGEFLEPNGYLVFEIGVGQADPVREIARSAGYRPSDVRKDYSGVERVVVFKR